MIVTKDPTEQDSLQAICMSGIYSMIVQSKENESPKDFFFNEMNSKYSLLCKGNYENALLSSLMKLDDS